MAEVRRRLDRRARRAFGLQPHGQETWKLPKDSLFIAKVRDVVRPVPEPAPARGRPAFGTFAVEAWPHDVQAHMGHAEIDTTMINVHHAQKHSASPGHGAFDPADWVRVPGRVRR